MGERRRRRAWCEQCVNSRLRCFPMDLHDRPRASGCNSRVRITTDSPASDQPAATPGPSSLAAPRLPSARRFRWTACAAGGGRGRRPVVVGEHAAQEQSRARLVLVGVGFSGLPLKRRRPMNVGVLYASNEIQFDRNRLTMCALAALVLAHDSDSPCPVSAHGYAIIAIERRKT